MKRILTLISIVILVVAANRVQADHSEVDQQVLGVWQLKMTTPDGEAREPIVVVGRQFDRYEAWYAGEDGLEPLKNVKLDGETLVGTIVPKENPDVTVVMKARLSGENRCTGTAKYRTSAGETGDWEFAGRRLAVDAFPDLMEWTIEFTTPDDERHTATAFVVSRGDNYYAWYSGKYHEVPTQKLSVNGDQVLMEVKAETRDGQTVTVKFKGTVAGDTIDGEAEYQLGDDAGSFPFTAKQAA